MLGITTIPTDVQLAKISEMTPDYMKPNKQPYAVVFEAALSPTECERILADTEVVETYGFHGCNAHTRECVRPLSYSLAAIRQMLRFANDYFFQFDIDENDPAAWLQSYGSGQDYRTHADGAPGQSRKLTAVAMLSDPASYEGGDLVFNVSQAKVTAPRTRGTVIVFPAFVTHQVTPIDSGYRQTINLGVWGPPFK